MKRWGQALPVPVHETGRVRLLPVLPLLVLLTACSSAPDAPAASAPTAAPSSSPSRGPSSDLTVPQLAALLLQDEDLPLLSLGRPYAEPELTTRSTPQLALCRPASTVAPHAVANVLGRPSAGGGASVFHVVSVFADETAARAAYEDALDRARTCGSYTDPTGAALTVSALRPLPAPSPVRAAQYELVVAGRTGTDARTIAQSGRFTVLLSSLGSPDAGTTLPQLQAQVLPKALARLDT